MTTAKCEKCGNACWAARGEIDLCTKCQIGTQSPTLWLLTRLCDGLKKPLPENLVSQRLKNSSGTLVYNQKTGECVGADVPRSVNRKDFVSMVVTVECENKPDLPNIRMMIYRWVDSGSAAIESLGPYKFSNIDSFVAEASQYCVIAVSGLINFAKQDLYFCSGCRTEKKNPPSSRHFAGTYCEPCWETYKKKNSRVCLRCQRPMWGCYC